MKKLSAVSGQTLNNSYWMAGHLLMLWMCMFTNLGRFANAQLGIYLGWQLFIYVATKNIVRNLDDCRRLVVRRGCFHNSTILPIVLGGDGSSGMRMTRGQRPWFVASILLPSALLGYNPLHLWRRIWGGYAKRYSKGRRAQLRHNTGKEDGGVTLPWQMAWRSKNYSRLTSSQFLPTRRDASL